MRPYQQMLSPVILNLDSSLSRYYLKDGKSLTEEIRKRKLEIVQKGNTKFPLELIRQEVVESWLRCRKHGHLLADNNPGPVLDRSAFEELLEKNELLLTAADSHIAQMEDLLENVECMILLSDNQGTILRIITRDNTKFAQTNEKYGLVPGVIWNEKTIGTCAHGISLLNMTPIQIFGPEHYRGIFDHCFCSSAPIFDCNRDLIGTLSIVCRESNLKNLPFLGLVISMARAIQSELQLALKSQMVNAFLETADEAIVTVDRRGFITGANLAAKKIFNCQSQNIIGKQMEEVLGSQPLINTVLQTGKPVVDTKISIEHLNLRLHLLSAYPLKGFNGKQSGCLLRMKKINKERKPISQGKNFDDDFTFDQIAGSSPQLAKTIDFAIKVARMDANLLIQGESGTGKEVFAKAIHQASRPNGPFIAVNCAAIPKTLIESELFGYERGAFTGAERQGKPGKIELADGGTLLLDEIGDMPLELQPVLLRVLEEKKVMRIGSRQYQPVDFRLIVATNKNLLDLVANNQFRADLYYRLAVFKIDIPPLRERKEDIMNLALQFLKDLSQEQQIPEPTISSAAKYCLLQYHWPGNVRQLKNAILYAINFSSNGVIQVEDLPEEIRQSVSSNSLKGETTREATSQEQIKENKLSIKEMEKSAIMQVLLQTGYKMSEAAKILGISRSTLYRKIKEYNL